MSTKYMVLRFISWSDLRILDSPIQPDDSSVGYIPVWNSYEEAYAHTNNGKFEIVAVRVGDQPNEDSVKAPVQKPNKRRKRKS